MQKPGVIIGQKGVKYGLITRKDNKQQPAQPSGRLAAFGGDSDSDEDNVEAQVARQAARKVADSKVQDMYASALAEDPNAFEYDSVYDSMQEQKAAPKQQEKLARRPKYIASLLEQAEVRKREQGITYERMLLKERQKEDHMYDNTEKFITSAYRRKLEEDKKWQESQKLKELEEEQNDVAKLGHMNNFFANLTKNVAMGGTGAAAAAQRSRPEAAAADAAAGGASPQQRAASASPDDETEGLQPPQQQQQQGPEEPMGAADESMQHAEELQQQRHDSPDVHDRQAGVQKPQQQQPLEEQQQQETQAAASGAGSKRKNTEDAVAAARERYLARKRQQQGA